MSDRPDDQAATESFRADPTLSWLAPAVVPSPMPAADGWVTRGAGPDHVAADARVLGSGAVPDGGDVPDGAFPDDGVPDGVGVPDDGVPDDGVPDDSVPDDGVPDDGVPDDGVPDDDLDLLDQTWTPPRRVGLVTLVLAGGLVAALGFVGGVLIQKNHDAGLSGAGSGLAAAARAFRNGGAGSFSGFGAGPGSEGTSGSGTPGSGAGASGFGSAGRRGGNSGGTGSVGTGTPVVVGTVVSLSGAVLVVQNFAGARVTVHVPAGTPVTTPGLGGLHPGSTVSVTGTKAADGSVTATSVTSRGSAG